MKLFCWFGAACFSMVSAHAVTILVADDQPAATSLIGKWTWTRKQNNCTEVYDFRADGNLLVTSGEEKSENLFELSADADQAGFYRLTITTVHDFGGKDCGESTKDDTGQTIDSFLLFDPSKSAFIICQQPNLSACYGPLNRAP